MYKILCGFIRSFKGRVAPRFLSFSFLFSFSGREQVFAEEQKRVRLAYCWYSGLVVPVGQGKGGTPPSMAQGVDR